MKPDSFLMKLLFIFLSVSALVETCFGATVKTAPQILVELGRAGRFVTVTVTNASEKSMSLPGLNFALSKGARGLYLSINDARGKLHPTCAMVDLAYTGDYIVPSRGYLQTNVGISFLKKVHCLTPGKYTITATYAVKNNWAVNSLPMTIAVTNRRDESSREKGSGSFIP